tara:strand:- start:346 stop:561 length:216 start_codon:yes stop_codon:yes gene_type:complete
MEEIKSVQDYIDLVELQKQKLGINNIQLSKLSQVNPSTINRILNGKTTPKLETVLKISRALNMTLKYDFLT